MEKVALKFSKKLNMEPPKKKSFSIEWLYEFIVQRKYERKETHFDFIRLRKISYLCNCIEWKFSPNCSKPIELLDDHDELLFSCLF